VIRKWSCSPWGLSFTPPHPTQALIIKAAFAVGLHSCSSFHFNDVHSNHELFYIYIIGLILFLLFGWLFWLRRE
jgi:hypothetical protein